MPPPDARHPELLAYRSEFPLLDASVYLNTCSLGARPERSRRRLDTFLADWDELGARAWYRRWLGKLDGLRDDVGALLGVD
ncbi:MAG: kynureninase, partial [Candidatus Limnocylindria bacterium]